MSVFTDEMSLVHKGLIVYNNICSPASDCAVSVLLLFVYSSLVFKKQEINTGRLVGY